jgi:hypothetical protein
VADLKNLGRGGGPRRAQQELLEGLPAVPPVRKKIPVLNIAGVGRTGSTLLEQVLAANPAFVSLGEARLLWDRGYAQGLRCSCGEPFHQCSFWRRVDQRAFGGLGADRIGRLLALHLAVVRRRRIPEIVAGQLLGRPPAADTAKYLEYLRAAYDAALSESGAVMVIDSTKDPLHGLLLSRIDGIDLHVVHLLRDPRAVAFSWQRKVDLEEVARPGELMLRRTAGNSARTYVSRNLQTLLLAKLARSYMTVRYEDFVADPQAIVDRVVRTVGLESYRLPIGPAGEVELPVTHSVSGNPRRRFGERKVRVAEDREWSTDLSSRDTWTTVAWSWPLMWQYGYLRDGRRKPARSRR